MTPPFITGPTAVGKTAVAIEIALALGAEILSIDSRQAYRHLDIGTAKPTPEEQARVRHHLLDLFEPTEIASAQLFAGHFQRALLEIERRGHAALAAGGSGLYVDACLGRLDPLPPANERVREAHATILREQGPAALHARLRACDPAAAVRLHPHDVKRVGRALEVFELTGHPMSELQTRGERPDVSHDPCMLMLVREPEDIDARIAARADAMLAAGLVREVEAILAMGIPADAPGLQAIGYDDFAETLVGGRSLDEAVEHFIRRTRRYARRQITWFRHRYAGVTEVAIPRAEPAAATAERCLHLLAARRAEA
jgi:tRNA dimethylallyltransferase